MADEKQLSREAAKNQRYSNMQRNTKKKQGRLAAFFKGVWSELKKVHWPSKKQLVNYTGVVIFTVAAFALAISLFDWGISSLFEWILSLGA